MNHKLLKHLESHFHQKTLIDLENLFFNERCHNNLKNPPPSKANCVQKFVFSCIRLQWKQKAIKIIWNLIQDVANLRIINLIESEKYVPASCAPTLVITPRWVMNICINNFKMLYVCFSLFLFGDRYFRRGGSEVESGDEKRKTKN